MSGKYRMAQAEGLSSITLFMSLLIEELCRKYHNNNNNNNNNNNKNNNNDNNNNNINY
jgi:hypothetical protein